MTRSGIITLTTDFGVIDPYVAMIKGVILSVNPGATIIDITHQVSAGSIMEGATIIKDTYPYFPPGTIHIGVIDPGVGSKRRPITVIADNHFFVGPDNGLFRPVMEKQKQVDIIHLSNKKYWSNRGVSPTFHGRDLFAPVAASLSQGTDPFLLGETIKNPTKIIFSVPTKKRGDLAGEIRRIDHFGNLITNISKDDLRSFSGSAGIIIKTGSLTLNKVNNTYSDVPEKSPLALIGSSDFLEIAVHMGRADNYAGHNFKTGDRVIISKEKKSLVP